jgi:hypothetical protein
MKLKKVYSGWERLIDEYQIREIPITKQELKKIITSTIEATWEEVLPNNIGIVAGGSEAYWDGVVAQAKEVNKEFERILKELE